jgi:hypothetical protein
MNTITNELDAAYARRATARTSAEDSAVTLVRAQRVKATADERVQELEQSLDVAESEEARRLEARIVAGARTVDASPPSLDEAIALELTNARLHANISGKALASIRAAHAKAQTELAAAERAVITLVDGMLDAEDVDVARQISHHLNEAVRIGKQLLFATMASEMHYRKAPPAEVKAALARLDLPILDRLNIATNLTKTGDTAALALRAARRAALIAGDEFPPAADVAA